MAHCSGPGAANSPGVEEEPTGEGDNDKDDGEVELELLVFILVGKPGKGETRRALNIPKTHGKILVLIMEEGGFTPGPY